MQPGGCSWLVSPECAGPFRVGETASPLFCHSFLQHISLQLSLGLHSFLPAVRVFKLLGPGHLGGVHAAKFGA